MSRPSPSVGHGRSPARLLEAAAPRQHVAQFYTRSDSLVRVVSRYGGEGFRRGEALLLVSRGDHARAITRRLDDAGFPVGDLERRGQLVVREADRMLSDLVVAGTPDGARFQAVIGGAVRSMKTAGHTRIRAFGEMVDLLRGSSREGTLHLEALWNELVARERIALLCAYSIDTLDPQSYDGFLHGVIAAHSHLAPVEDAARLERAVERAYREVFGDPDDAAFLHRAFVRHYPRAAAMPDAQAAILAAREFVPAATGMLLDRVRRHYGQADRDGDWTAGAPSGEAPEWPEV